MLKSKINQYVKNLCSKALIASKLAALNTNKDRNNILKSIANNLDKDRKNIEKSNSIDINNAYKKKIIICIANKWCISVTSINMKSSIF